MRRLLSPGAILLLAGVVSACGDARNISAPGGLPDSLGAGVVLDLRATEVSDRSVTLSWTSPAGRDSTVPVLAYDLRMSSSPITEAAWDTLQRVSGVPRPLKPGISQTHELVGLQPATPLYFAMRTEVTRNWWSRLSNPFLVRTLDWMNGSAPRFVGSWGEFGVTKIVKGTDKASVLHLTHHSGRMLALTNATRGRIQEFDLEGNLVRIPPPGNFPVAVTDLALLDDGYLCTAVVSGEGQGLWIFDDAFGVVNKTGLGQPSGALGVLTNPTDVLVTGDKVFVADSGNQRIQVFDHRGQYLNAWAVPARPVMLAMQADGSLIVSTSPGPGVWICSQDGEIYGRIGESDIPAAREVKVRPDSTIWVKDGSGRLLHMDPEMGGVVLESLMLYPIAGFDMDADGYFYQRQGGGIHAFLPDGTFEREWGLPGGVPVNTFRIDGESLLVLGGDGRLYRSGLYGGVPRLLGPVAGPAGDPLQSPVSLFRHGDNVYVVDNPAHRVRVHTLDGTWLRTIGAPAEPPPEDLKYPILVEADHRGDLYAIDRSQDRVAVYDRSGALIRVIPGPDDPLGPMSRISGMALDRHHNLFVTERNAGRIRVYDTGGFRLRDSWDFMIGVGASDWRRGAPGAIVVASDGTLFIQDFTRNTLTQFTTNGEYLSRIETYGPEQESIGEFRDITADDEGGIYLARYPETLKFSFRDP